MSAERHFGIPSPPYSVRQRNKARRHRAMFYLLVLLGTAWAAVEMTGLGR